MELKHLLYNEYMKELLWEKEVGPVQPTAPYRKNIPQLIKPCPIVGSHHKKAPPVDNKQRSTCKKEVERMDILLRCELRLGGETFWRR